VASVKRRKWSELSPQQRRLTLVLASIELALTATAAVDLARRPAAQVRGPKAAWVAALFVQPFGPIAYLVAGHRDVASEGAPA